MPEKKNTKPAPLTSLTNLITAVHGIANNGSAVGRVTGPVGDKQIGMTVFVRDAAPGETVEVAVTKTHKRHLDAELVQITTPAASRIVPKCSHFGDCGGCDLQYMTYESQVTAKAAMLTGMLRILDLPEGTVLPWIVSPEYGYRRRMVVHIGGEESRVGLYQRKSKSILPLTQCPVCVPLIEDFFAQSPAFPMLDSPAELMLEAGENGLFGTIRVAPMDSYKSLYAQMREYFVGGQVYVGSKPLQVFGEEWVQWPEGRSLPGGFAQANTVINDAMQKIVVDIAKDCNAKSAYDLYSGNGNFALLLAAQGLSVTAVEDDPILIDSGRGEAQRRNLSLSFKGETVEAFLAQGARARNSTRAQQPPPDLIIADPPRSGLEKNVELLPISPYMILISCDTASAVRDLKELRAGGWQIKSLQPLDMSPQTTHVELITYLTRE
jgi:23S rRNA (uracil1939-C5)-methyltransferase